MTDRDVLALRWSDVAMDLGKPMSSFEMKAAIERDRKWGDQAPGGEMWTDDRRGTALFMAGYDRRGLLNVVGALLEALAAEPAGHLPRCEHGALREPCIPCAEPAGLDAAAEAEAEAVLPEGWFIDSWEAHASTEWGDCAEGVGATPADALRAIVAKLQGKDR